VIDAPGDLRQRANMKNATLTMTLATVVFALSWGIVPAKTRRATPKPVGTVHLEAKQVAAGVGWEWGNGVFNYQGKHDPFTISGLTVVGAGASRVEATGNVYNLRKLDDFKGTYTAVEASGSAGGGAGIVTMKNVHGVRITLHSVTQGVSLQLGPEGMQIALQ